jgi:2-methylcitrate dehydratase PrpD
VTATAWPGLTDAVVDRCRSIAPGVLPGGASLFARHCLLDWFGCALAGSREPVAEILAATLREPSGAAALIGRSERTSELTAALINGAASHALDYDDLQPALAAHPSAAIVPALLAAADGDGATGERLLAALAAGVEAGFVLGCALNPGHYDAGWHGTGTIGTIGAAAGAMHLLGGDEAAWRSAIGLAATQAAGLKVMFGTMAKPLHAGKAASNGLLAARLALAGMDSRSDALEAPRGFAHLYAGGGVWPPPPAGSRLAIEDVLFKYHASCTATQPTIENALALTREHGLEPDEIERIEVRVAPELEDVCGIREPRNGTEAKFSLYATTALALAGENTADIATFAEGPLSRPEVVALRERVGVVYDRAAAGRPFWAAMRVVTRPGTALVTEVELGVERDAARQEERLVRKFRALAGRVLDPDRVEQLQAALLDVEGADDVRALAAQACGR